MPAKTSRIATDASPEPPGCERQTMHSIRKQVLPIWISAWIAVILSAVFGFGRGGTWIAWAGVLSLTLASIALAIRSLHGKPDGLEARSKAMFAAWFLVAVAFLIVLALSDNWAPAWVASIPALTGWYCFQLLLNSTAEHSAIAKAAASPTPLDQRKPAPPHVEAKAKVTSDKQEPASPLAVDMEPLLTHWLDELARASMRIKPVASIVRRDGQGAAAEEIDRQIRRIRYLHGQLKTTVRLNAKGVDKVRLTQVIEFLMDPLLEEARTHNVTLSRPDPAVVPAVQEKFARLLMSVYHLLLGAIESCRIKSSRTVAIRLAESQGCAYICIEMPNDPTRSASYKLGADLLRGTQAVLSTGPRNYGFCIELAFPATDPRSRVDLRPVVGGTDKALIDSPAAKGSPRAVRVLFVDDDPDICELAVAMLGLRNAAVDTANSLETVEKLLDLHHYDAVILDVYMPHANGLEIYERIKELAPDLAEKTVFCTGAALGDHVVSYLRNQECPVISKPFDSSSLTRAVRAML